MNFDEFLQLLVDKRRLADPEADIRDAFRLFDKDADGYLTLKDLQQVASNCKSEVNVKLGFIIVRSKA